jgi:hypothetical protein
MKLVLVYPFFLGLSGHKVRIFKFCCKSAEIIELVRLTLDFLKQWKAEVSYFVKIFRFFLACAQGTYNGEKKVTFIRNLSNVAMFDTSVVNPCMKGP